MNPWLLVRRLILPLLIIGGVIAVSCIPERRAPPPPTPTAAQPGPLSHDLAGQPRDSRSGITPGALEVETSLPSPTPKDNAETAPEDG